MTSRLVKSLLPTLVVAAAITAAAVLFPVGAIGSVPAGQNPETNVTTFNENLTISSPLQGNVQVFGGDVVIEAPVSGRVVVFGGDVEIRGAGRIDGDLVCLGGEVSGVTNRTVAGKVYAPRNGFQSVEAGRLMVASMREPFSFLNLALELSLLAMWLLGAIVITLTNGREVRSSSLELRASPLHNFVLGLVAFTSLVLTAIVFSYLIPYFVGLLLLAALAVFAVVAKVYGMVVVFHALGMILAGPRNHEDVNRRRWMRGDLAAVVIGFGILGLLRLIPYVGPIIWMTASVLGVGVALSTKFGRREPWFLAWRPAEA